MHRWRRSWRSGFFRERGGARDARNRRRHRSPRGLLELIAVLDRVLLRGAPALSAGQD